MTEVASAYVSLMPSARGFGSALEGQVGGEIHKTGGKLGGMLSGAIKKTAVGGALAVGTAVGATLYGGFRSALQQQDAQKVLSGLYGSAAQARKTLAGLNQVASQSPLGHDAFRKGAESLAYAGVQGNKAVTILKNVGLAITAAGGNSQNMDQATGAILRMVNAGKVQLDTLQQLSNSGVPILSGLAKHFGTSIADVNKMASAGKIQLTDVLDVMQKAQGKTFQSMKKAGTAAAQSFGNQWKIAKDNIMNAVGKAIVPLLDKLAPLITTAGQAVAGFVTGMSTGTGAGGQFASALQSVAATISSLAGFFKKFQDFLVPFGATVLTLVAGWKAYTIAVAAVTAVQTALDAVLAANPIGLVVIAIAGLVAGLVVAYKKSETFRNIVNGAFSAIKTVVVGAMNAVKKVVTTVIDFIKKHWKAFALGIVTVLTGPLGALVVLVATHFDKVKSIVSRVVGAVKGILHWFAGLPGMFRDWFMGAYNAVKNALGKVLAEVRSLPGKIKGALSGAGHWLIQTGKNIVRGLISGIGALKNAVVDALLALIPGPLKKFAGKLGIASPSKVFAYFGRMTVAGFVQGVDEYGPKMVESLRKQLDKALSVTKDKIKSIRDEMRSLADSITQAWMPDDLFGGSLADLRSGLAGGLDKVNKAYEALWKLTGVNKKFLSSLFSSGNLDLIQQLASNPALARSLGSQYASLQGGAAGLGEQTAAVVLGSKLDRQLNKLEDIRKELHNLPERVGHQVGKAIEGGAKKASQKAGR